MGHILIKQADDKSADIATLTALLTHPQINAYKRNLIEAEIRNVRAGARAEQESAYELDFHHRDTKNWAVIHDLRIEWQGRVAQIDHLLISRMMDLYVCETKSFSQGVALNERGEFTAFYQGKPQGIPSPLEQNRKHIAVLDAALRGSNLIQLPKRLGLTLQPKLIGVVLVGPKARITLPKQAVPGAEAIIKSDQLRSWIERADQSAGVDALMSMAKVISPETLEQLARQITRLHRPLSFDWHGKFGLPVLAPVGEGAPAHAAPVPASAGRHSIALYSDAPATEKAATDECVALPADAPAQSVQAANVTRADAAQAVDPAPSGQDQQKLPTSKLGRAWGLNTAAQTLKRLEELGYLVASDKGHQLTEKALAAGASFEHGRHGPYFLWPADLPG